MNFSIKGGTVIDAVNKGVAAFVEIFKKNNAEANLTSLCFDVECRMSPEVVIRSFSPKYSVGKNGRACIAEALSRSAERLSAYPNGYVVFIGDGVLEPSEDEGRLEKAISDLKEYCCYAVGFTSENGEMSLDVLLDYFSNRQIISFDDQDKYVKLLEDIAERIIKDEGKNGASGKSKRNTEY